MRFWRMWFFTILLPDDYLLVCAQRWRSRPKPGPRPRGATRRAGSGVGLDRACRATRQSGIMNHILQPEGWRGTDHAMWPGHAPCVRKNCQIRTTRVLERFSGVTPGLNACAITDHAKYSGSRAVLQEVSHPQKGSHWRAEPRAATYSTFWTLPGRLPSWPCGRGA